MDNNLIEEIDYKGYKIEVCQDFDPETPREWDNLGTMLCFHRGYNLGDKTDLKQDNFDSWGEVEKYLIKQKKAVLISPLYLYDHSGISIKIGSWYGLLPQGHAEFDSGQVGFIYCTAQDIKENYNTKRIGKKLLKKAQKVLEGEVSTYNDYLTGQVYGYRIIDKTGECLDSCWGYYGDTKDMIAEAKDNIDKEIKSRLDKRLAKLKILIKNHVSLDKREKILARMPV